MKTIILTGGGTAGHVTPNLALIPSLKEAGYEIRYISSLKNINRTYFFPKAALLRFLWSWQQSIIMFPLLSTNPI